MTTHSNHDLWNIVKLKIFCDYVDVTIIMVEMQFELVTSWLRVYCSNRFTVDFLIEIHYSNKEFWFLNKV